MSKRNRSVAMSDAVCQNSMDDNIDKIVHHIEPFHIMVLCHHDPNEDCQSLIEALLLGMNIFSYRIDPSREDNKTETSLD